jgi:isopentenyl diphosphate isomerase/L-lactate dehydrogenase-like FMN-dependent dehydrogenase
MVLSTYSTKSLEEVKRHTQAPLWFQVYFMRDRKLTADLVRRAERCGFKAIVLTVDVPYLGREYATLFAPFH